MFLTGNLCLFDQNMARARGYDNAQEAVDHVLDEWHGEVGKNDHVWILGNLSVYKAVEALSLIRTLPGYKHLMYGPRDLLSPAVRQPWEHHGMYHREFVEHSVFSRRRFSGADVVLAHHNPKSDVWWSPKDQEGLRYVYADFDCPKEFSMLSPNELNVSWGTWDGFVTWDEVKEAFNGNLASLL